MGTRGDDDAARISELLRNFTTNIIPVSTESAEMIKHAINSFLALSITFMNEIARICEKVGADAREVEHGLKSEARIGPKAYLSPGGPFAGGTLARDVVTLDHLASQLGEELFLIPAIKMSNDQHKRWAIQKLREELGSLRANVSRSWDSRTSRTPIHCGGVLRSNSAVCSKLKLSKFVHSIRW